MGFWEGFAKYVGIQGILSLVLVGGYVAGIFTGVPLPEQYDNLMNLVVGFYLAKNGVGIIDALRGTATKKG